MTLICCLKLSVYCKEFCVLLLNENILIGIGGILICVHMLNLENMGTYYTEDYSFLHYDINTSLGCVLYTDVHYCQDFMVAFMVIDMTNIKVAMK